VQHGLQVVVSKKTVLLALSLCVVGVCAVRSRKLAPPASPPRSGLLLRWCGDHCVLSGGCCTREECQTPPDACRVAESADCIEGTCMYSARHCEEQAACLNGACQPSPVAFTVESRNASYKLSPRLFQDGTLRFKARLTNRSRSPLVCSAFGLGNVSIESVKVNGRRLLPNPSEVSHVEAPLSGQIAALRSVLPGGQVEFEAYNLRYELETDQPLFVFTYEHPERGHYEVVFGYQYRGPDDGRPNVFHGLVESNKVEFDVE
jgi:hypothetical protein